VKSNLGYKYHWALADYLQRSARHIASKTDLTQAYRIGHIVVRKSNTPYRWTIGEASLSKVANVEKKMPRRFITRDGYGITQSARTYLTPLIQGEAYPPYHRGLPKYVTLKNKLVKKKLNSKFTI